MSGISLIYDGTTNNCLCSGEKITRRRKACGNFWPKETPWEDDGWDDGTMTNPDQER